MNLLLDNVVSDITGVTGLAIIRAIVAGERDARGEPGRVAGAIGPHRQDKKRRSGHS